jgi:hypothetical protein
MLHVPPSNPSYLMAVILYVMRSTNYEVLYAVCLFLSGMAMDLMESRSGLAEKSRGKANTNRKLVRCIFGNLSSNVPLLQTMIMISDRGISVPGHGGPLSCEMSRLPHFLDNRFTDGGQVVSLKRSRPLSPERFLVLISVGG